MKNYIDLKIWELIDKTADSLYYIKINIKDFIGSFFKTKKDVKSQIDKNTSGIILADTHPKSRGYGCNYTYVKLEFLHKDPERLFNECLCNIETSKDLSRINLNKGYAYVRGLKYVGDLFDLGTTSQARKFIESSNPIVDGWVRLSILKDKKEWFEAPEELRILF